MEMSPDLDLGLGRTCPGVVWSRMSFGRRGHEFPTLQERPKAGAWRDQPQVFPARLTRGGRLRSTLDGAVLSTN